MGAEIPPGATARRRGDAPVGVSRPRDQSLPGICRSAPRSAHCRPARAGAAACAPPSRTRMRREIRGTNACARCTHTQWSRVHAMSTRVRTPTRVKAAGVVFVAAAQPPSRQNTIPQCPRQPRHTHRAALPQLPLPPPPPPRTYRGTCCSSCWRRRACATSTRCWRRCCSWRGTWASWPKGIRPMPRAGTGSCASTSRPRTCASSPCSSTSRRCSSAAASAPRWRSGAARWRECSCPPRTPRPCRSCPTAAATTSMSTRSPPPRRARGRG